MVRFLLASGIAATLGLGGPQSAHGADTEVLRGPLDLPIGLRIRLSHEETQRIVETGSVNAENLPDVAKLVVKAVIDKLARADKGKGVIIEKPNGIIPTQIKTRE